jgi:hypothetical protein
MTETASIPFPATTTAPPAFADLLFEKVEPEIATMLFGQTEMAPPLSEANSPVKVESSILTVVSNEIMEPPATAVFSLNVQPVTVAD